MSNRDKRIVILTEVELRKTLSRLTYEIIETIPNIENLLLIIPSRHKGFLEFRNLTLYPYEKQLIDLDLLTNVQKEWINRYHSEVYNKLKKYLKQNEKLWLLKKTEYL